MSRCWLLLALLLAGPVFAQPTLRLATYNVGLGHDGPGLLLKDILDQDDYILNLAQIIDTTNPDILLLTGFDTDYQNIAISRFNALFSQPYPYVHAPLGNAGLDSGLDISGNGRLGDWGDAWGFGRFDGNKGMVLLSRFPIGQARSFNLLKWQDFGPEPLYPDGSAYYPAELWPQLRLASRSLWDVELLLPSGPFHVLAAYPTPPVFDGEEDANGLRNEAEISFLNRYINGGAFADDSGTTAPMAAHPFAILADLNADPADGESRHTALLSLLNNPYLQDPKPESEGALHDPTLGHTSPPALDTVEWDAELSGNLRVDYVLPSAGLAVTGAGVFWPLEVPLLEAAQASHRLVWVEVRFP